MNNISDWLNRADYTAEERRNICAQIMSEAQYWDVHQYLKMMHDSTKRPWVGLTDDEIWEAYMESPVELNCNTDDLYAFSRTIEAKLKEKNT
jgi:hypothetical protein